MNTENTRLNTTLTPLQTQVYNEEIRRCKDRIKTRLNTQTLPARIITETEINKQTIFTLEQVIEFGANYFNISANAIKGKSRVKPLHNYRKIIAGGLKWLKDRNLLEKTSNANISKQLGSTSPATFSNLYSDCSRMRKESISFDKMYNDFVFELNRGENDPKREN